MACNEFPEYAHFSLTNFARHGSAEAIRDDVDFASRERGDRLDHHAHLATVRFTHHNILGFQKFV